MDVHNATLRKRYGDPQNYFDVSTTVVRSNVLVTSMTDVVSAIVKEKWSTRGKIIKQVPFDFVFGLRRSSNVKWYPIEDFRRSMTFLRCSFCHVVFCMHFDHQFQKYTESNFKGGHTSSGFTSFSVFFSIRRKRMYRLSAQKITCDLDRVVPLMTSTSAVFDECWLRLLSFVELLLILLYHTLLRNSVDEYCCVKCIKRFLFF